MSMTMNREAMTPDERDNVDLSQVWLPNVDLLAQEATQAKKEYQAAVSRLAKQMSPIDFPDSVTNRFWDAVDIKNETCCWTWLSTCNATGYGTFRFTFAGHRLTYRAHRVACELALGKRIGDLHVLHSCDNPPCCNPGHLSTGTHLENMEQRSARRRNANRNGERNPSSKLTADKIRFAAKQVIAGIPIMDIAAQMSVDRQSLSNAIRGVTWAHLKDVPDVSGVRRQSGCRRLTAKVTPDQVRMLRSLAGTMTWRQLGELFGISRLHAKRIARGQAWQHVQ